MRRQFQRKTYVPRRVKAFNGRKRKNQKPFYQKRQGSRPRKQRIVTSSPTLDKIAKTAPDAIPVTAELYSPFPLGKVLKASAALFLAYVLAHMVGCAYSSHLVPATDLRESQIGEIYDHKRPRRAGIEMGQSSKPLEGNLKANHIFRTISADLSYDLTDVVIGRTELSHSSNDLYRHLNRNGGKMNEYDNEWTLTLYYSPHPDVAVGPTMTLTNTGYRSSAEDNVHGWRAGVTGRYRNEGFKGEATATTGGAAGDYPTSHFVDKRIFNLDLMTSYSWEDTGSVVSGGANFKTSDREQSGNGWHLPSESKGVWVGFAQRVYQDEVSKVAVRARVSVDDQDIGSHYGWNSLVASLGVEGTIIDTKTKGEPAVSVSLDAWTRQDYSNKSIPGVTQTGKSNQEHGFTFSFNFNF